MCWLAYSSHTDHVTMFKSSPSFTTPPPAPFPFTPLSSMVTPRSRVTFDDKKRIARIIEELPGEELSQVLTIVRTAEPDKVTT